MFLQACISDRNFRDVETVIYLLIFVCDILWSSKANSFWYWMDLFWIIPNSSGDDYYSFNHHILWLNECTFSIINQCIWIAVSYLIHLTVKLFLLCTQQHKIIATSILFNKIWLEWRENIRMCVTKHTLSKLNVCHNMIPNAILLN